MPDIVGAMVGAGFLILWLYCIYDVVTTDDALVQHLPKVVWILVVVLLSDLGSLLWLGLGRPRVWARRAHDPTSRTSRERAPGERTSRERISHERTSRERSSRETVLDAGGADGQLAGLNPIVRYREEQARLRLREAQLNRREEELRRREAGES